MLNRKEEHVYVNMKYLWIISLYTTIAQPDSHYIATTWFQGSTPAQPEILTDNLI